MLLLSFSSFLLVVVFSRYCIIPSNIAYLSGNNSYDDSTFLLSGKDGVRPRQVPELGGRGQGKRSSAMDQGAAN